MELDVLVRHIDEMGRQLDRLPEIERPPPTTLQVLNQSRQEGEWQRFLAYFLTPGAPHRLEHSVVERFLRGFSNRDDTDFVFSQFDLEDVQVATEVPIPDGRLDVLVWCEDEWFILFELKIDSSEGDGQTERYACAESFQNVDLDPTAVTKSCQHYIYVTPEGSQPESDDFTAVQWSWIASQLRTVQESDYGSHPARTTAQLDDFIDTIETELTMTEHERNEAAKAELYVNYYDEMSEITDAFESEWQTFLNSWGRRLAATLDEARVIDNPERVPSVSDVDVMIELPDGEDRRRYWVCRQAQGSWSWLFPTNWWTRLDNGEPVYRNENPNARVGFLHRPEFDRQTILEDQELTFYLRNAPSGNDDFYPRFASQFNSDDDIAARLPEETERRGVQSNVLEATYDINIDEHGDLFTGYIQALASAVNDHVVSNHRLIERIDAIYEDTRNEVDSADVN